MSDGKSYTKKKFELDIYLLGEVNAIPIKCKIMIWRSHTFNGL